ncbi:MAG: hypothetical protein HYW91_03400, partial [Candidatus Sungbacteria bacterium]|nr:hypothetical protein [Candidatus Sungbacteria bacterium]
PLALTALSVLGGEIFGSAFILQLQLSRSLILWKLFLNLLFVYYAYRHVTENPRDFLYNFSLLGIIAAFIVSEKLMFIFLPVQIVLWAWKSKYAKIVSWTAFIAALPILWYFANLHGTKNFSEYAPIIISIAILSAVVVYLLKERIFGALIPLALVIMLMGAVSHASSFSIYPQGILQNKDFMEACEWVKKNIGQDALFIAEPFSDAGGDLRLVCLRSVLVTKKDGGAGMFNRDFALEWRKRFDLVAEAEKSPGTLKGIVKEYGADYVFADNEISLSYPRVFENTRYIIYALEER